MDTRSWAQEAQDRIGWADQRDHEQMGHAMLELARVVVQLTRDVAALERKIAILQADRAPDRSDIQLRPMHDVHLPPTAPRCRTCAGAGWYGSSHWGDHHMHCLCGARCGVCTIAPEGGGPNAQQSTP